MAWVVFLSFGWTNSFLMLLCGLLAAATSNYFKTLVTLSVTPFKYGGTTMPLFCPLSSGVTAGGGAVCPPDTSHREISADLPGKRGKEKTGKWRRKKKRKSKQGRWKMENGKRKSHKMRWGHFFFFSIWKTSEICFGSTKMVIVYREKAFYARKYQIKWLCTLWKIFLLRPCLCLLLFFVSFLDLTVCIWPFTVSKSNLLYPLFWPSVTMLSFLPSSVLAYNH